MTLSEDRGTTHAADQDESARPLLKSVFWSFQVLFWTLVASLSVGMSYAVEPSMPIAWLPILARVASGFVVTAGAYHLLHMPKLQKLTRALRWPLVTVTTVSALLLTVIPFHLLGMSSGLVWMGKDLLGEILPRATVGLFWCTVAFTLELLEGLFATELRLSKAQTVAALKEAHALQMEASAYEHEVHRLQAQMNPHFLFNALNTIAAFKHSPEDVSRITQDLADFLRTALRDSRTLEPLSRELSNLEKYLAVQQTRFGNQLTCRIACDRVARSVLVPPLIVQPLLENAIAYGMQTSEMPLRIDVAARVDAGRLCVTVTNSGHWVPPSTHANPGTGLTTLRKRLALLAGPTASAVVSHPARSVRVVVELPADLAGPLASPESATSLELAS